MRQKKYEKVEKLVVEEVDRLMEEGEIVEVEYEVEKGTKSGNNLKEEYCDGVPFHLFCQSFKYN